MPKTAGILRVRALNSEDSTILGRYPENLLKSPDTEVANFALRISGLIGQSERWFDLLVTELLGVERNHELSDQGKTVARHKHLQDFMEAHRETAGQAPIARMRDVALEAERMAYKMLPTATDPAALESGRRTFERIKGLGEKARTRLMILQRVESGDFVFCRDLYGTATPTINSKDSPPVHWPRMLDLAVEQTGLLEGDPDFAAKIRHTALDTFATQPYRRSMSLRALINTYARFANDLVPVAFKSARETTMPPKVLSDYPRDDWPMVQDVDGF